MPCNSTTARQMPPWSLAGAPSLEGAHHADAELAVWANWRLPDGQEEFWVRPNLAHQFAQGARDLVGAGHP